MLNEQKRCKIILLNKLCNYNAINIFVDYKFGIFINSVDEKPYNRFI